MIKKLTLLAMAVGALVAFAAPAAQAAAGSVTNAEGGDAASITAKSSNLISTTNTGAQLECATVELNLNTTAQGTYSGSGKAFGEKGVTPHEGPCKIVQTGTTVPVTVGPVHVSINGDGTATTDFDFSYKLGPSECTFVDNPEDPTQASYSATTDELEIHANMIGTGPAPCASSGQINGDFQVTDENSEPAEIH